MKKTIQDMRNKFSKEIEALRKSQAEIMELKNKQIIIQLENLSGSLTSRMNQIKDRMPWFKGREIKSKNMKNKLKIPEMWDNFERPNFWNISIDKWEEFQVSGIVYMCKRPQKKTFSN